MFVTGLAGVTSDSGLSAVALIAVEQNNKNWNKYKMNSSRSKIVTKRDNNPLTSNDRGPSVVE